MFDEAVAHHRSGRFPEAAAGYRAVVEAEPDHADAWQLLGLVLHRLDRPDEALAALDRCLSLDPEHAPAWANRGLVLRALGRDDDALASFDEALALRPGFREPQLNRARLLAGRPDGAAALAAVDALLAEHPDDAEGHRIRGFLLVGRGRPGDAAQAWATALRHRFDPQLAMALGQLQLQRGQPALALVPLVLACRRDAPAWALLADAAAQSPAFPAGADDVLAAALRRDDIDHQRLERAVRGVLAPFDDDALLDHPLLIGWLTRCLVQHPDDLRRLPRLHARLVERARSGTIEVAVVEAFAIQAWITEHAQAAVLDLRDLQGPVRVALDAIVRPLPADTPPLPPPLERLWTRTVGDALREEALRPTLPTLALGDDPTSAEVRALYEENPYPRLVAVHRPTPVPLDTTLAGVGLKAPTRRPLAVLVAGCGTGQHPLQTAARYADVSVTAVDLSRRSLARAARVAADAGIALELAQADILALGGWERRFDVVESVGVLHHLADPLAGWKVLRGLLAEGGIMRIGLYPERGRADVVAARELVHAWGLSPDPAGLREARARFLALPDDHPAHPVVSSPDFASLSGLRDLVFHVCEHRFTPTGLAAALDALGLRFAGFQHSRPDAAHAYRERWPDDDAQIDLARWDRLEEEQPRLFSGMYVFWCVPSP